jgi:hypothetical protein
VNFGYDVATDVYVVDGNKPWEWPSALIAGPSDPLISEALAKAKAFAKERSIRLSRLKLVVLLAGEVRQGWRARERRPRRHCNADKPRRVSYRGATTQFDLGHFEG